MKVYFIWSAGYIKIGQAIDPKKRLAELQTSTPYDLSLLGVLDDVTEGSLHQRFKASRVRGEWFSFTDDLREFLEGRGINCKPHRALPTPKLLKPGKPKTRTKIVKVVTPLKPKQLRGVMPTDDLTPVTRMVGCLVCNQALGTRGNLCSGCGDEMRTFLDLPDPRYPENEPHGFWEGAQGRRDVFDQALGPKEWPFPDALVNWMSWVYESEMREHFERGAMFTRTTPASIRLAGPLILRRLFEQRKVKVADSNGGGYWYAKA